MYSCFSSSDSPPHPQSQQQEQQPSTSSPTTANSSNLIITHEPKAMNLPSDYPPLSLNVGNSIPFQEANQSQQQRYVPNPSNPNPNSPSSPNQSPNPWTAFIKKLGNKNPDGGGGGMSKTWVKRGREVGRVSIEGEGGGGGGGGGREGGIEDARGGEEEMMMRESHPSIPHHDSATFTSHPITHSSQSQPDYHAHPASAQLHLNLQSPNISGQSTIPRPLNSARSDGAGSFFIPQDRIGMYREALEADGRGLSGGAVGAGRV